MKKNWLLIVLLGTIVVFCVFGFAFGNQAEQYVSDRDFLVEQTNNGNSVWIKRYIGSKTDVNIPPQIKNLPVIFIKAEAFKNKDLVTVTIPDSVTEIGMHSFANNNIENVIIPNNVSVIDNFAFSNNKLTDLIISDSVTYIGEEAFRFNQLTNLVIGRNVINIKEKAFQNNLLTSIIIPDSVTIIGMNAFADNQLNSITIGNNVQMEFGAFGNNNFVQFYQDQGSSAGLYTYRNNQWNKM